MRIVEQELNEEECFMTQSGKIDLKRITGGNIIEKEKQDESKDNLDQTDKFRSISYRGAGGCSGGEPCYNDRSQVS